MKENMDTLTGFVGAIIVFLAAIVIELGFVISYLMEIASH